MPLRSRRLRKSGVVQSPPARICPQAHNCKSRFGGCHALPDIGASEAVLAHCRAATLVHYRSRPEGGAQPAELAALVAPVIQPSGLAARDRGENPDLPI